MKVESEEEFERVGGTATGGGTFWGLGSLLTKAKVNKESQGFFMGFSLVEINVKYIWVFIIFDVSICSRALTNYCN